MNRMPQASFMCTTAVVLTFWTAWCPGDPPSPPKVDNPVVTLDTYRSINVRVHVQDPARASIASIIIAGYSDCPTDEPAFAITDVSGNATLSMSINVIATRVFVQTCDPSSFIFAPKRPWMEGHSGATLNATYQAWSFDLYKAIPVPAGSTTYTTTIDAYPACNVRLRVVKADGTPEKWARLSCREWNRDVMPDDGKSLFYGLRRGVSHEILIGSLRDGGGYVKSVTITAEQSSTENLDLGDVQRIEPLATGTLQCTVRDVLDDTKLHPRDVVPDLVSAVSQDGTVLYEWKTDASNMSLEPDEGTPRRNTWARVDKPMAPGTYYVTAGRFANGAGGRLLDVVRAGRQAELDAAGMPKCVISENEVSVFVLNLDHVRNALDALAPLD